MNVTDTYLVMVTPDNHNKYYRMIPQNNGSFTVEYGRVGARPMKRRYPISQWDAKYREKISKGYSDQSGFREVEERQETCQEDSSPVGHLVRHLMNAAKAVIRREYRVASNQVTPVMVREAQNILNRLSRYSCLDVEVFNEALIKLFTVLPRKMSRVQDYLAKSLEDFGKIVEREQELLDIMAGQASTVAATPKSQAASSVDELLRGNGLEIRPCTDVEMKQVRRHMGKDKNKCAEAFRVVNKETEKKFEEYCKEHEIGEEDIHYYYHGSLNRNFWHILLQGLRIRNHPNGTMFGDGIYFANLAQKSIRYTSLRTPWTIGGAEDNGYLAVFKVAYKNPLHVSTAKPGMNRHRIEKGGNDALFAHAGVHLVHDEIIIYREEQATIYALIKLKKS